MALDFINQKLNRETFSGRAAVWVTTDNGAAWTRLSQSAELTITPETSESEVVNNAGHGRFADVVKNYIIEGKFIERGEDVRQMWSNDSDQSMRGKFYGLWIQGAQLAAAAGTAVYENWTFYQCRLKRNHQSYSLGTGDPMFTFTFYAEANETCADVVMTAPTGDACFKAAASTTLTVSATEFHATADIAAA